MIVSLCPCCGSLAGDLSEVMRMKRDMSKRIQLLLEIMLKAEPTGLSRTDLAIAVYGKARGTSRSGLVSLGNDLSELRRKIDRFGYFIPTIEPGENYRILPLEASL